MHIVCVECGTQIFESFGSVKGGDIVENGQGLRSAGEIRVICGICATFYANVRWPRLLRPSWKKRLVLPRKNQNYQWMR